MLWVIVLFASFLSGNINGQEVSETAPYTVINTENDYEERLYPAQKWVTTKMDQTLQDLEHLDESMFWRLFGYISGAENRDNIVIPMSTPVTTLFSSTGNLAMSFYLAPSFQENPPQPTNPLVEIEERPDMTVFVRIFGGFANDSAVVTDEQNQLWSSLTDEDKSRVNRNAPYYSAGYDSPFQLVKRHNEIWMIVLDA